jgi:hypothetical protein
MTSKLGTEKGRVWGARRKSKSSDLLEVITAFIVCGGEWRSDHI